MTQDEIRKEIAKNIRKVREQSGILDQSIAEAINILGQLLCNACPEYFNVRMTLQSQRGSTGYTAIFDLPSDLITLVRVRDLGSNALVISSTADNGSGLIRVTFSDDHGLEDGAIVFIHDANTETNGTWQIDYDTSTHATTECDLLGSTWSANPAAGYVFQENDKTFTLIERKPLSEATGDDSDHYFLRNSTLVVDDPTFDYDILIDYYAYPTALTQIPSRYHFGLVAYGAVDLIELPGKDAAEFADLNKSLKKNSELWSLAKKWAEEFRPVVESRKIGTVDRIKKLRI